MSRSKRKTPVVGFTTSRSEKQEKRLINRALRRKSKVILKDVDEEENYILPIADDYMNVWSMSKDGKQRMTKHEKPDCKGCRDKIACLTDETYKEYKCLPWWRYNSYQKIMRK